MIRTIKVSISDKLDLEITEIVDRQKLLAEAKEIIRFSDVELGIDIAPKEVDRQKVEILNQLEEIGELVDLSYISKL
jgi:hypothetical protein